MTNRDKVLRSLASAELCDDCLSLASGVKPRQTVNAICIDLATNSIIHRPHSRCGHCHKAKLTNLLTNAYQSRVETEATASPSIFQDIQTLPWYWEGNVQAKVVEYLVNHGNSIRSVADTRSREAGKDIVAVTPDGHELWVSVKGYPEKSANTQARHWFSGAVFDLILYHGQSPNIELALALPDGFVTYTNLVPRIAWLKKPMPFQVFWVSEAGHVRVE